MFSDLLSIAVNVTDQALGDDRSGWRDIDIWRLLTTGGWLVTVSRSTIVLDKYSEEIAA